jgi:hypothetical protein
MGMEVNNPGGGTGGGGGTPISALVWTPITEFGEGCSAFGSPYEVPGFSIDAQGQVHLRGLLSVGESPTGGQVAFTLPAECHPGKKKPLGCGNANVVGDVCILMVETTGEVKIILGNDGKPLPVLDGKLFDLQ